MPAISLRSTGAYQGWLQARALRQQTTSKFPFRWWGVNSTLSGRHQFNGQPGPRSAEEEALDASESRDEKSRGYADSTRSASFPTDVNKIMTRFGTLKDPSVLPR
jgi:hypothetical protein